VKWLPKKGTNQVLEKPQARKEREERKRRAPEIDPENGIVGGEKRKKREKNYPKPKRHSRKGGKVRGRDQKKIV